MPLFRIHHVTKYEYNSPVKESVNQIRIYAAGFNHQQVLSQAVVITGNPDVNVYTDYFGNQTGDFNLMPVHRQMVVESQLVVQTNWPEDVPPDNSSFDALCAARNKDMQLLMLSYPEPIRQQFLIDHIINQLRITGLTVCETAERCNTFIYKNFEYKKGITGIETTVDEILDHKRGVCQDFAHVLLHLLRTLSIPSRYVSGYICPNKSGMRGEGATHAWVEYFSPGRGWSGIDPTNNCKATNNYVKLAVGRDFKDCSPVKGSFKGMAKQSLSVFVSVGYEDGHVFEDISKVRMERQQEGEADAYEAVEIDYTAPSQQQQQQQQQQQ